MTIWDDIVDYLTGIFEKSGQEQVRLTQAQNYALTPEARDRILRSDNPIEQANKEITDENFNDVVKDPDAAVDRFFGSIFDTFEDEVAEGIERKGPLTPENIEDGINQAEGNAIQIALGVVAANIGLEILGGTQLETHEEAITQIATFLTLEEVLGRRLGMLYEKGVDPALEARVAKQTRSEFVALGDAVEVLLRAKTEDEGWLTGENVDQRWANAVGSNEPVNPENLVEEWGIRDDNLEILERVALESMEFEELIETPAELGLIVPDDVLDDVLDLAGYPENLKDFLRQIPGEIPRSNRAWEERTSVEALVDELETLVADEELTPEEARALIPDEVEVAKDALQDRFANLQSPPSGAPTRSLVENSGTLGFTTIAELEDRLERLEYNTDRYSDVVDYTLYNEVDGNLQEAFALGLISEGTYGEVMDRLGLDSEAQGALMAGQSLSDVVSSRLEEQADPADQPVSSISGIGESRASGLRAVGIETVADLAAADVQTVSDAAQVEEDIAQGFIDAARLRTE